MVVLLTGFWQTAISNKYEVTENNVMNNIDKNIDPVQADTQTVLDHFATGKPLDPEVAKRVRERGRRIREEVYRKHGLLDIGVPAIRELRGELPSP